MDDGEMTYGNSDEYRAVYLDGLVIGSGDPQYWDGFNSSYILTNSGTATINSTLDGFNSGWDNVWTSDYSRTADYVTGEFLRGAWDTRLRFGSSSASDGNSHSVFPDGRYAFSVRALSQATAFLEPAYQEWGTRTLPSNDLNNPNGSARGIIVDNFLPYVDSVIVYSKIPGDFSAGKLYFTAGWNENYPSSSASYDSTVSGYLLYGSEQQLRKRLYIAVKYSEPCSLSVNDVWITAEMENEQTWHSIDDWGYFEPDSITANNWIRGLPDQSQHSGYWALYKLKPAGTPMDSYKGEITLHISGDVTDLEGNHIDADPSTIVPPRDPQGNWDTANYEAGNDDSYSWGLPEWTCTETPEDAYFIAEVGDDQVYSIALSYINPNWMPCWEAAWIDPFTICDVPFTPCTYNCGIWIERLVGNQLEDSVSYYRRMNIVLIKPDIENPVVIEQKIKEGIINWFQTYTYTWENSDAAHFYGGEGNRYFWMRDRCAYGDFPSPSDDVSSEYWYCADAVTGTYIHRRNLRVIGGLDPCDTWYSYEDTTVYYVNYNYTEMEQYLQPDGDMLVPAYYVFYDDPTPVFMDSVLITAPSRDYRSIQEVQMTSSVFDSLSNGGPSLILPTANPSRGEVTVSVLNCIGEEYEIHMYDLLGRELSAQYGTVFANEEMLHVSTTHIPDGMYLITAVVGDQKLVQKVTVLR
ncbi:MAG: hypothetical protein GF388_08885 [Candidatus Aegiribacteria sp.]|nr:hypothetical protein [Candidatus Aegiribacteria sp.]MBD3295190.1 hypothetical protein [Candidatus Fermentibacteria bacterium]